MLQTVTNTPNLQTRNEVWRSYYGAEYAYRYYQGLAARFLKGHNVLRGLTVCLGGGAVAPTALLLFGANTQSVETSVLFGIIGVALASVSLANYVGNYAKKAAVATSISKSCAALTKDFADLLSDIDQRNVDDRWAREKLGGLTALLREVTYTSESAGIPVSSKDKISKEAEDAAYRHLETLYAR